MLFLIALFLSPLFMLIPSAATSGALVMVGVLMLDSVKQLDLGEVSEAFPAFITMITMVLCYSIADGIYLGILCYVILKLCTAQYKRLNITLIILAILFNRNFVMPKGRLRFSPPKLPHGGVSIQTKKGMVCRE